MPPIPGRKPNWTKITKTVDSHTVRHNESLKPVVRLSLLQEHRARWTGGCGAEICSGATRVICRGTVPCDVLFVGEAPGESENALGKPFIGPAGKLLDRIVLNSLQVVALCATCGRLRENNSTDWVCVLGHARRDDHGGRDVTTGFTNLVCCIPRESDGDKATAPNDEDVECCRPRLEEFIRIASPRLVVCVGSLARDYLDPKLKGHVELPEGVRTVAIKHPAAILRSPVASQGLDIQRCTVQIRDAVLDVFGQES